MIYTSQEFYDRFSSRYREYADAKRDYIAAVDSYIITQTKSDAGMMLDVGSGDGFRAQKIAAALKVKGLALMDNSKDMCDLSRLRGGVMKIINTDISSVMSMGGDKYDLVTCLWNVFGHIPDYSQRLRALRNIRDMMSDKGVLFLDVNNRYNMKHYGIFAVLKNIILDISFKSRKNGDYVLRLPGKEIDIETNVHLFSPDEIESLLSSANLRILDKVVIDYKNGSFRKTVFGGQLVYKLSK
jgi:SAM-dependent methyltransferase